MSPDQNIKALTTQIKLNSSLSAWIDVIQDYPLFYEFGYRTNFVNDPANSTYFFMPKSPLANGAFYLPSADPNAPKCGRISFRALVRVCDQFGACSIVEAPKDFSVQNPDDSNLNEAGDLLNQLRAQGDFVAAAQLMDAILAENCNQIGTGNEIGNLTAGLVQNVAENILTEVQDSE